MTYETKDKDAPFRQHTVPLTVGLDFDIHRITDVQDPNALSPLEQLHLAIPYGKFMEIETSMLGLHTCESFSANEVALNQ